MSRRNDDRGSVDVWSSIPNVTPSAPSRGPDPIREASRPDAVAAGGYSRPVQVVAGGYTPPQSLVGPNDERGNNTGAYATRAQDLESGKKNSATKSTKKGVGSKLKLGGQKTGSMAKSHSTVTARDLQNTCKARPVSNKPPKGGGGGGKAFVPWCR